MRHRNLNLRLNTATLTATLRERTYLGPSVCPEGTDSGYKPGGRTVYEILSVLSGQIAVEIEEFEVSDPGLPGPHNEKTHYIVLESSFQRKIVESVG